MKYCRYLSLVYVNYNIVWNLLVNFKNWKIKEEMGHLKFFMVTGSVFIFLFSTRGYKIWKRFSEILNQGLLKPLVTVIKGSNKCVN